MDKEHRDPYELDLIKPRLAWYKQKTWNRHQDTVYWVDMQLAQRKGFKFYQTRCNAIILYDTLPVYCILKVVVMESGKIIYEKVFVSPRPPPTISLKDNGMKELYSEVAGSNKDTPTNPNKTKNPIIKNGETRGWIEIHPKLRVDAFKKMKKKIKQERRDPLVGRFLQVHISYRMCNQVTLHREFRIDTRRKKLEQKTDGILQSVDPVNKEQRDPNNIDLEAPRLAWYHQTK